MLQRCVTHERKGVCKIRDLTANTLHTQTLLHQQTHARAHAHSHAHTHAHTLSRSHTHTHTHTRSHAHLVKNLYSMAALLRKDTRKGLKGVRAILATVKAGGTLGTTALSMRFEDIAIDLRVEGRE